MHTRTPQRLARLVIIGLLQVAATAFAETPMLEDLLRRAGALTEALQGRLAVAVAREEYQQRLLVGRDRTPRVRRKVVSDVAWVPTGDAMVWTFFRDVISVDGAPVVERLGRLQELFSSGPTADARQHAGRLLDESARYNLGQRRTVNTPAFALAVLHPRNQSRFRFTMQGGHDIDGVRVVKVHFSEVDRPTLTRTSKGTDVAANGTLCIEPEEGALVESELYLDIAGYPAEVKVRYRPQTRIGAWLPLEMQEAYGNRSRSAGEERTEATARYSDFRRAEVEVLDIRPVR